LNEARFLALDDSAARRMPVLEILLSIGSKLAEEHSR